MGQVDLGQTVHLSEKEGHRVVDEDCQETQDRSGTFLLSYVTCIVGGSPDGS